MAHVLGIKGKGEGKIDAPNVRHNWEGKIDDIYVRHKGGGIKPVKRQVLLNVRDEGFAETAQLNA